MPQNSLYANISDEGWGSSPDGKYLLACTVVASTGKLCPCGNTLLSYSNNIEFTATIDRVIRGALTRAR